MTPTGTARSATRPPRKRAQRGRKVRARKVLAKALQTSSEIQGSARQRQRVRAAGQANAAASLDSDLLALYDDFSGDRRELFATGLVPDGTPYGGRTWKAS